MAKQAPLLTVLKFFGDAPAHGSLPVFVAKQGQFGVDFGLHLNGHAPLLALAGVVLGFTIILAGVIKGLVLGFTVILAGVILGLLVILSLVGLTGALVVALGLPAVSKPGGRALHTYEYIKYTWVS